MKAEHIYRLCEENDNCEVVAKSTYDDVKTNAIENDIDVKEEIGINVALDFDNLEDDCPTHSDIYILHTIHINHVL